MDDKACGYLISIIDELLPYVLASEHEGWGQVVPTATIVDELQGHRDCFRAGDLGSAQAVRLLFAPTGALQELAISNGWHTPYTALAASVDALTESA